MGYSPGWYSNLYAQYEKLADYVINVDRLEQLTGIDFFCNLPDDIEQEVESATRAKMISDWNL
jgi:endonuclease G